MKLSIIIPVFKGENTIITLFNKIQEALENEYDYEVIFVCDNAIDGSWTIIKYLHTISSQKVKGYKLKYNYGQHRALLYGMQEAAGDYIITLDEDMQHDPKYIPQMLSFLMDNKLDVVYGTFSRYRKNGVRIIGSKLGRQLAGVLIPNLYKGYSPFRIISFNVANRLLDTKGIAFIDGQLGNVTNSIGEYSIEHFENKRPSSYSFIKLVVLAISVIINYSGIARNLIILLLALLIYFALGNAFNLPGKDFVLTGLPAFILLVLASGLILYTVIQSVIRKKIEVVETIRNN